jgi:transaldolase
MEIWLDTVNLEVVEEASKAGILSGVTTNPSILTMTKDISKTLSCLLDIQEGPIAVQVTAEDSDRMVDEARAIFAFSNRMIIKIPVNPQSLAAIKQLRKENIPVLGTAILHPAQVLLAANQGATYIAPYFSHIGDIADPMESLRTMVNIVKNTSTKILVASLRNLNDLLFCSQLGVAAVTIKDELYYKLIAEHSLVKKFTHKFLSDWKSTHGDVSIMDLLIRNESVERELKGVTR